MSTQKRHTANMIAANKLKSEVKQKAVEDAISMLIANNRRIDFATVASEAGVTASFLYQNRQFSQRIKELRHHQQHDPNYLPKSSSPASEASKSSMLDALRMSLREKDEELKAKDKEISKLKEQALLLYGEIEELKLTQRKRK